MPSGAERSSRWRALRLQHPPGRYASDFNLPFVSVQESAGLPDESVAGGHGERARPGGLRLL